MRHTSSTRHLKSAGFTLVEMLAVAPIIVLVLATFIGLMINMTGEVLASSGKNGLTYDTNQMLQKLDTDIRNSVSFPPTSFTPVPGSHQGYDLSVTNLLDNARFNGDSPFSTSYGTLILRQVATTKSPFDSTRAIVYKKNTDGSCSSTPYQYDVVYFFSATLNTYQPGSALYRLWRRVVFDKDSTPCDGQKPWQMPTCAAGQAGVNCKADDEEWGSNGFSIYGATWFYADIPDTTVNMYVNQDWIHPYYDGSTNCSAQPNGTQPPADSKNRVTECNNHVYDPISPTTGKMATSIYFLLGTARVVAGKVVASAQYIYSTRAGSL